MLVLLSLQRRLFLLLSDHVDLFFILKLKIRFIRLRFLFRRIRKVSRIKRILVLRNASYGSNFVSFLDLVVGDVVEWGVLSRFTSA